MPPYSVLIIDTVSADGVEILVTLNVVTFVLAVILG